MKNIILSFVLFLFAVAFSTAQNKVVTIHFPDTINEKEVTAHYSIKGLLNYF
jgi:hypothetical protein